ncbi:MAG: MFS transporter [Candidatus Levybacteria bacterium]|nr:MFS transporter [Candidatus Levybacteria bacterium]
MRRHFFWLYLTVFVNIIGFGMIFPILPLFAEKYQASSLQIGFIAATFSLGQFLFSPFFGRLSDRFGRKPIILSSMVISGVSYLMLFEADSLPLIFLARFLSGVSSAANFPVASSYIADITTRENRTKYMGKVSGVFSLGFVVGPVFGGLLGNGGFSSAFLAAAILSFANLLLAFFFLPESISQKAEKFVLKEGLLNVKAIYNGMRGDFSLLFLLLSLWAFYISNFQVAIPLFAQDKFNFGALQNGFFFSLTGIVAAITQWFLLPYIVKRVGEIKTIFAGILFMAIGQILAPLSANVMVFYLFFVISIFGSGLNRPSINALLSKGTREGQGTTMGLAFSFESIGRFVGPLAAGAVMGSLGLAFPFWITAALLLIGLFFFWKIEMKKRR